MNGWILACLGVMAAALVAMAIGQVVLAVTAARAARQAVGLVQEFRRELGPVMQKINRIADDASRASALAAVQVERVDQIMETTARRIDEILTIVQDSIIGPLRQGTALVAGLRAALEVFRSATERRRPPREDDDALFIG